MEKSITIAAMMFACMVLPSAADEYGVEPAGVYPAAFREVCTTTSYGVGIVDTDCRSEVLPPPRGNPGLRGICTIYYGRRTCH
jgi:hypothetical protein